ncbi:Phospho-N-acetylmuramoyl-pentapeptide-transferase [Anaerosphaera aminiphila DSM 21120]|uniref:Phospho-N-acetylmuramoyl-pentapeptide-transferase n=1 Tax=Anaerosphaera aminiphila DSM 21120 TaxID=1120995 RepID=A0A1M5SYI7_9FIRM|nr:phospho-N-acetylmuramoyl-pentapeptide-transferase [Anaerosphaera aminiphila]SHH43535.1 Phospho-N-acetylmuramoyl-pentapeptide-transferase [Anaerosphaera aminiphila DSM 21120]
MQNYIYILVAIFMSLIIGYFMIPVLKKMKAGQSIREDGPQSHLSKSGTPTMGGLIFVSSLLMVTIISKNINMESAMLIFSTVAFGLVGFLDDYIKVVKKRNLGLTAKQKLLFQIITTLILLVYQYNGEGLSTDIIIPILNKSVNLGLLYIPFILFVVVGTVNSVNLTDGLDGLSSGVTIICLAFFAVVSHKLGRVEVELFSIILLGALIGFLYYNKFPAKVFMGDTGSLALGGAISAIAVLLNLPLILPIAGGIYFIETLSVIIQIVSFKTRGKRVFLMAPLHHHFEQKGWKETKVVIVFYLVEIVLCVIAYKMLF